MATKELKFSTNHNQKELKKDSTTDLLSLTSKSSKERGFEIQQLPIFSKPPKLLSHLKSNEASLPIKSTFLVAHKRGNMKKGTIYTGSKETSQPKSTNCNPSNT